MLQQSILCCYHPGQINSLNRTRTSILRPNELVEIQGSYWPRILIVSERNPKKTKKTATKVSRRIKKKMIRQLKKSSPALSPTHQRAPISPSFEASPNSLSSSLSASFDQNTGPCWKPSVEKFSKRKMSSFTGRPVFPQLDSNTTKILGQSSSGLKGPRRRTSKKIVVAPR